MLHMKQSGSFLHSQLRQPQSLSGVIRLLDLFPIGLGPGRSRAIGLGTQSSLDRRVLSHRLTSSVSMARLREASRLFSEPNLWASLNLRGNDVSVQLSDKTTFDPNTLAKPMKANASGWLPPPAQN